MKKIVQAIDQALGAVPGDSAHPGQADLVTAALEEARSRAVNFGILEGDLKEDDALTVRKPKAADRAEAAAANAGSDLRDEG